MHSDQFRAKPFDIFHDICFETVEIDSIVVKRMQDLLLCSESHPSLGLWRLLVESKRSDQLLEIVCRDIRDCTQRRRLKVFKSSVIKDLAYRSFERRSTEPRRHDRARLCRSECVDILLQKWLWLVLLELILIRLYLSVVV